MIYNVDTDLNMEVIKLAKETKKQRLQRERRNKERREKYDFLRSLGYTAKEARKLRQRSWERLYEEHGYDPKKVKTLKNLEHTPPKERYKDQYHMLRQAGFSSKEANKFKSKRPEQVAFLVNAKIKKTPKELKPVGWDYHPFDKHYLDDYAYRVTFTVIYDNPEQATDIDKDLDEIPEEGFRQEKTWTIVSDRPLTADEIIDIIMDRINSDGKNYGASYVEEISVYPMMSYLT